MADYLIRTKPITTPKKTPESVQIRDSFETPRYATELLMHFIPQSIDTIWECASGNGRMAQVFTESGYTVYPSDIKESDSSLKNNFYNFITGDETGTIPFPIWERFQNGNVAIITNPPFSVKREFIEKAFEYKVPFAFLINADYSGEQIDWIKRGCEKIIPTRRINYLTPNIVARVNIGESANYLNIAEIPQKLLYSYSSSQFHSMWLTYGFGLGRTETFVDLPIQQIKENII